MLLRQSMLYFAANVFAALLGFTSVIALTRLVAPAEYGIFVIAMSLGTVLATCFFTWQRHAILRFQSGHNSDVRLSLLMGAIATLALHPLALVLLVTAFDIPLHKAVAAVLLAAAGSFYELGQEILRARQQVATYVRGSLIRSLTSLALCLVAVAMNGGGIGLVAAVICSYLVSTAASAKQVWAQPRSPASTATLVQLANYGLPITVSGLFVALSLSLDRFVIYTLLGTEAVGLYGATADFVRQCAIVPAVSASLAIAPLAVASLGRDDGEATARNLGEGVELLLAVLFPAVAGLSVAAPQIAGTILGVDYREAAVTLIPLIGVAFLAHTISQQYVQLSFGLAQRPRLYITHTGSIFLVNAALIVPFVKLWGTTGAATSLLLSEVVGVALGLAMSRQAYPLPLVAQRVWRVALATAVMVVTCLVARAMVERTDVIGLVLMLLVGATSYGLAAIALDIAGLRSIAKTTLAQRRAVNTTPAAPRVQT